MLVWLCGRRERRGKIKGADSVLEKPEGGVFFRVKNEGFRGTKALSQDREKNDILLPRLASNVHLCECWGVNSSAEVAVDE